MSSARFESNSFGQLDVLADKYYGAQTARSLNNFPIGEATIAKPLILVFTNAQATIAETVNHRPLHSRVFN